ncbi:MAG: hypothetical protein V1846_02055 [Candidatus Komeilibacteria bacterium]
MSQGNKHQLIKAQSKMTVNLYLLTIAFTIFTFIITINPSLVRNNIFLALQLTLAIPLLISSVFVRARISYATKEINWDRYGYVLFIVAYSFLINVVGILLAALVYVFIAWIFFGVNILCALLYSTIEIIEDHARVKSRVYKDGLFIAILFVLGILPILLFIE